MPNLAPIKRKDLIYYFRQLGFDGPYSGGNHQYMKKDTLKVRLPNPHQSEIRRDLLVRILKQANIEKTTWEDL
ncbi:MAG: type II toxin-antitoxin system HicA family toxin [Acidobacteria bacterium]|jgi:predicted RNA binding protein YcfA (HicA-like mRNA interferase family)|nr:type II toxin-antitoxin system HicA family toxin [Acidobacteriota bacterium]